MMKRVVWLLGFLILLAAVPLGAVSYPPYAEEALRVGTRVYLFHSGTDEVRRAIKVGEVLPVYREYPPDPAVTRETGKVRVLATVGHYYFEAEVIDGAVIPGTIALKGTAGCLITGPPESR